MSRVFLLSPANCNGERARMLLDERARFPLAQRLRAPAGVPIGEAFAFISGLYFRGKLAYVRRFACPPHGLVSAYVITPNCGLWPVEEPVTLAALRSFAAVDIAAADERYRKPVERDVKVVADVLRAAGDDAEAVLLGSVASGKYVDVLLGILGERLRFPAAFVGRGDMSRGGLMLRAAKSGDELPYIPIDGAVRRGPRPPKLPRTR